MKVHQFIFNDWGDTNKSFEFNTIEELVSVDFVKNKRLIYSKPDKDFKGYQIYLSEPYNEYEIKAMCKQAKYLQGNRFVFMRCIGESYPFAIITGHINNMFRLITEIAEWNRDNII